MTDQECPPVFSVTIDRFLAIKYGTDPAIAHFLARAIQEGQGRFCAVDVGTRMPWLTRTAIRGYMRDFERDGLVERLPSEGPTKWYRLTPQENP